MTIEKVIERVDAWRPNVAPEGLKAAWLIDLDGRLLAEFFQGRPVPGEDGERLPPTEWPRDRHVELLLVTPYENVYELYMLAMLDFYNREPMEYQNSAALFNEALDGFRKHYHRTHTPRSVKGFYLP